MSEPIWCNVKFKIPTSWNVPGDEGSPSSPPWFVKEASDALCNGCGPDTDEENETYSIWGVDGEGNYGLADSWLEPILDWAREQRIPYVAIADAKYEWLGEYIVFDGSAEHSRDYSGESIVLPESTYRSWAASDENDYAVLLERHFMVNEPPDLSDISIAHLPTECPPKPEGEQ